MKDQLFDFIDQLMREQYPELDGVDSWTSEVSVKYYVDEE